MDRDSRKKKRHNDSPSVEDYLRMDEEEKDVAIQRAVMRLQTRIHEILYLMESGIKMKKSMHKKERGGNTKE
jgi:hypothetical protein